jgi:hypothetical protein
MLDAMDGVKRKLEQLGAMTYPQTLQSRELLGKIRDHLR